MSGILGGIGYKKLPEDEDDPPPPAKKPAPTPAKKTKKPKKKGKKKGKGKGQVLERPLSRTALRSAISVACTVTPTVPSEIPASSGGTPVKTVQQRTSSVSEQSSSSNSANISTPTAITPLSSSHASLPTDISFVSDEVTQPPEESSSGDSASGSSDSEPEVADSSQPPAKVRKTETDSKSDQIPPVESAENLPSTSSEPATQFREPLPSTESDHSSSTCSAPSQHSSTVQYSRLPSREPTPTSEASDVALSGKMATLGDPSSSVKQPSLGLSGKISCQLTAIFRQRSTEPSDDVFAGPSEVRPGHGQSGEQQEREADAPLVAAIMSVVDQAGLHDSMDEVIADFKAYFDGYPEEQFAARCESWKQHIMEKYKKSKK